MKRGFQRAGKQPNKFQFDCAMIVNYLKNNDMSKAIEYAKGQGIDEKTFADIAHKVEKEQNRKQYFVLIITYKDGSQGICKGNKATALNFENIDKSMLYKTMASAEKGRQAQQNDSFVINCEIKPIIL